MRNILEKLWYGNVCPSTRYRRVTKETRELIGYIFGHHDNLQAIITGAVAHLFGSLMIKNKNHNSIRLYQNYGSYL